MDLELLYLAREEEREGFMIDGQEEVLTFVNRESPGTHKLNREAQADHTEDDRLISTAFDPLITMSRANCWPDIYWGMNPFLASPPPTPPRHSPPRPWPSMNAENDAVRTSRHIQKSMGLPRRRRLESSPRASSGVWLGHQQVAPCGQRGYTPFDLKQ